MTQRNKSINGIPALLLFFVPCGIGWVWILSTLWRAVFG